MNAKAMTMNEIRRAGIELLTQNLGAVGMVRFLQQNELGWGDYTQDRHQWLGNPSLSEIVGDIKSLSVNRPKKAKKLRTVR